MNEKLRMVNSFINVEIATKIILGALQKIRIMHPMDYCLSAVNIKILRLDHTNAEFQLIMRYINNSHPTKEGFIHNIYAIERKGEPERIAQWKHLPNRMILWHGSKIENFLGILSQGLRIAPPEASHTGWAFGQGIYFADEFEKSFGYTYSNAGYMMKGKKPKFMLLCEVALGKLYEITQFTSEIPTLPKNCKSVKGLGQSGPNPKQNVILSNKAIMPVGEVIQYEYDTKKYRTLQHNEYIVYDESQVRIRYLVEIHDFEDDME